ncbi:MAG: hypothetical protein IJW10_00145 [Clostridia bacterium]|nr:hypothetical protein [Clostridia bacterium]
MKKYLLPENVNWYRANMHCHTTISDGQLTPEEVKEAYKAQGYSIVAYTDHEILLDHSYLNDESFLALTSAEYSANEGISTYHPDPLGQENNSWTRRRVIHMNIFSKDPHNTFQPAAHDDTLWACDGKYKGQGKCDGFVREYNIDNINETIRRCNEAGFLVQYNHPVWSLNDKELYLNLKGLWSLEILNYATERITGKEYCPYIYDEMVASGMYDLNCTMGDDNHNRGRSTAHSFGGSTMIGARELKYDQIIEAMEKGHIYCTSGRENPPLIHALYVEDNMIKVDCSPATSVFLNGFARAYRVFENDDGTEVTHAEFPIDRNDIYFRITVRDKYGNNAHTHNYFIKDIIEEN